MLDVRFAVGQARSICHYDRLKIKVLKCNSDIFFFLTKSVFPKITANIRTLIDNSVRCTYGIP
jgi:hypothetical protein